jgi:hypothetical protein
MCTYSSSPSKVRAFSTSVRRSRANFNGWQRRRSPLKIAVPAARRGCRRRTAVPPDGLFCRHPVVHCRRRGIALYFFSSQLPCSSGNRQFGVGHRHKRTPYLSYIILQQILSLQICRFALLFEYLSILEEENKLKKTSLLRTIHLYKIEGKQKIQFHSK